MTTIKRRVATVSAPLLLALSLTACGGGDAASEAASAPDDASSEEFCKVFLDQSQDLNDDADPEATLAAAKDLADQLSSVGTPADFSDEARDGFEVFIAFIGDLDEGDVEDFSNAEDPSDVFGGDDADKVTAFTSAAVEACIGDLGGDLEDQLGDLPDDFPSDSTS